MSSFFFAALAGFVWMGLMTDLSWGAFATGALLGGITEWLAGTRSRRPFGPLRALRALWIGTELLAVFLWDLLVANLQQMRIVLSPRIDVQPGWVHFRTRLETRPMRALLGTMISLVPGSLTYDEMVDADGRCGIGMHVLDSRTEQAQVESIRRRLESRLLRLEQL